MIRQLKLGFVEQGEAREIWIDVLYSDRKTFGLEIGRDGTVKLRVPKRAADRSIRELVGERKNWIVGHYLKMEQRRAAAAAALPVQVPDFAADPRLEKAYRELARARLEERTAFYARQMGVGYGRIAIRAAKTRWGSCSAKGNLNFHWKLILLPPELLDYVVVHELAHRKQMNHSPAFWEEVAKILPDYQARREKLKTYEYLV